MTDESRANEIEFEKYARKGAYHWTYYFGGLRRLNAGTKARYDVVVDCLRDAGIGRAARVLDVGCGDGALARDFRGDFRLVSGYRYDFDNDSFDAVVCSDVIEHVAEPLTMLREIRRVLRPGGIAVLTTPIRFTEWPIDPMHVKEWFVDEFVEFCVGAFGAPERVLKTHPVFWYEAYTLDRPIAGRFGRLAINALTKLGFNPLRRLAKGWRCYTMQAVVLRKSDTTMDTTDDP